MAKIIPLFDGGFYKRGVDSGRHRSVLSALDAEMIFADPELPGPASPSSIGSELNMSKYAYLLCDLEVGDEILIGLIPDASIIRALFMMSHDKVTGFTGTLDLVSVAAIAAEVETQGGLVGATGVARTGTGTNQVLYDFANGLGDSTEDAHQQATLYGTQASAYRNNAALVTTNFATPIPLLLGEAQYLRFTVTAIGNLGIGGNDCCSTCNQTKFPTFQVGAIYDLLCVDKQRVRKFCNCPEPLCGEGCPDPCDEDTDPPVLAEGTTPSGTVGIAFNYDLNDTASESISSWTAAPLPSGLSLDAGTGIISGIPNTVEDVDVSITASDACGNVSDPLVITLSISGAPV